MTMSCHLCYLILLLHPSMPHTACNLALSIGSWKSTQQVQAPIRFSSWEWQEKVHCVTCVSFRWLQCLNLVYLPREHRVSGYQLKGLLKHCTVRDSAKNCTLSIVLYWRLIADADAVVGPVRLTLMCRSSATPIQELPQSHKFYKV